MKQRKFSALLGKCDGNVAARYSRADEVIE